MYFLYFLPACGVAFSDAVLEQSCLSHLGPARRLMTRGMTAGGPGEAAGGTLVADGRIAAGRLSYEPDAQVWHPLLDAPTVWVGMWAEDRPTEQSCRRPQCIRGHTLTLSDQEWTIPLARVFPEGTALPRSLVLTAEGLTLEDKPEFVGFSGRVSRLWRQFCRQMDWAEPDGDDEMSVDDQWRLCVEALSLNYYLAADEVNLLGLLDTETLPRICALLLDVPAIEAAVAKRLASLKKKSEPGTCPPPACGACGSPDASADTGRPGANLSTV